MRVSLLIIHVILIRVEYILLLLLLLLKSNQLAALKGTISLGFQEKGKDRKSWKRYIFIIIIIISIIIIIVKE